MLCSNCKKDFTPTYSYQVYCCDQCRLDFSNKKKRYQRKFEPKLNDCCVCGKEYIMKRKNSVTCSSRACRRTNATSAFQKNKKGERNEYTSYPGKHQDITKFKYYIQFQKFFKLHLGDSRTELDKRHATKMAYDSMRRYVNSFSTHDPIKKLLLLEKEYMMKLEKRTLTYNIKKALNIDHGTNEIYTLDEIGKVLGITRERIRQIEANALKRIAAPKNARVLKDYLYSMKEGNYEGEKAVH